MKSLGDNYEEQAACWLQRQGLTIIERNFRCRVGELDIIGQQGQYLVFIEVRARSNSRFASAAASVDLRKRRRLVRAAQWFLQRHRKYAHLPCRFDVVAFQPPQSATEQTPLWIRGAFTE
ncbi:YraN family protein [Pseudohalioglobus lutimaris]|uniref:UPF0102 protein C0039_04060 n=1 Tax=Pseudohalioglobus lutimaris TaxID=1737061 RepID=A0A2N5X7B8_9GAMM|nr:YraN family protein [Pseudohalioglobus lutimaris]PLW70383.1 YraN family protein [Pseudohalioglobus lutimaris]